MSILATAEFAAMRLLLGGSLAAKIRSCLSWIQDAAYTDRVVEMSFGSHRWLARVSFPFGPGDFPRFAPRKRENGAETNFFIGDSDAHLPQGASWIPIFQSPGIGVWERPDSNLPVRPLRWGFTDSEKAKLLSYARKSLQHILQNPKEPPIPVNPYLLPDRFSLRADVVVTLWSDQHMRGARRNDRYHLAEGIIETAAAAARDERFGAVQPSELEKIRIQISVIRSLRIPLGKSDLRDNSVSPTLGYEMVIGEKRGAFLPHVLSVSPAGTLMEHLEHLVREKLGTSQWQNKNAKVFLVSLDDFIEDENLNPKAFHPWLKL